VRVPPADNSVQRDRRERSLSELGSRLAEVDG